MTKKTKTMEKSKHFTRVWLGKRRDFHRTLSVSFGTRTFLLGARIFNNELMFSVELGIGLANVTYIIYKFKK